MSDPKTKGCPACGGKWLIDSHRRTRTCDKCGLEVSDLAAEAYAAGRRKWDR